MSSVAKSTALLTFAAGDDSPKKVTSHKEVIFDFGNSSSREEEDATDAEKNAGGTRKKNGEM